MRCTKANRGCGGYENDASSPFRFHEAQYPNQSATFMSTARKCSLPIRLPIPGTDVLPEETLAVETSHGIENSFALRAFFHNYCVISTNPNLSQGFLSGLERMAYRRGPKSTLAKGCQAVAFASHGKALRRPRLTHISEMLYQELLGSLATAIEIPASANTTELRLIAMLLGLYQVFHLATALGVHI